MIVKINNFYYNANDISKITEIKNQIYYDDSRPILKTFFNIYFKNGANELIKFNQGLDKYETIFLSLFNEKTNNIHELQPLIKVETMFEYLEENTDLLIDNECVKKHNNILSYWDNNIKINTTQQKIKEI